MRGMSVRRAVWRTSFAAASLIVFGSPANAQNIPAAEPGRLPPVTVTAPETIPPKRTRQAPRRERATRNIPTRNTPTVQPSQFSAPAAIGVTPDSAVSGPGNLQPTAASEQVISGAELNAWPVARVGEVLEVVPGLIVTQHSGEGKANQYFLRGFNLDHGTDLAITVDGMPVNMPTHGHGQGYADINFLIPELVRPVNVRKGPYFADEGDFASAGAVGIDYLNRLPKNIAAESPSAASATGARSRQARRMSATARCSRPVEAGKYNGPWDVPDHLRKLNGVLRYSQGTATDGFTLTGMAYSNGWNSTDQVPQRAIDQGVIGRFGSLDPTDGGTSSRFSLSGNWAQSSAYGQSKANAYVIRSRSTLQQLHLLPRRSRQRRPVQPDRPPHGLRVQCQS